MAGFDESQIEHILAACGENVDAIASTLQQCFDLQGELVAGESGVWEDSMLPNDFRGPGVVTLFFQGDEAAACFIPGELPLPPWYLSPNESQKSRLQTLSMEWSLTMFPADIEVVEYRTDVVTSLQGELERLKPTEGAAFQEWRFITANGEDNVFFMIWPLTNAKRDAPSPAPAAAPAASQPATTAASFAPAPTGDPYARLRGLPVSVSVRLAEKRIPLSQLLTIGPGAMVAFNKSCEDPLDLYINNVLYGRGEVVKIGEKFGLKISHVNVKTVRESKILLD